MREVRRLGAAAAGVTALPPVTTPAAAFVQGKAKAAAAAASRFTATATAVTSSLPSSPWHRMQDLLRVTAAECGTWTAPAAFDRAMSDATQILGDELQPQRDSAIIGSLRRLAAAPTMIRCAKRPVFRVAWPT